MGTVLLIYVIATLLVSILVRPIRETLIDVFYSGKKRWRFYGKTKSKSKKIGLRLLFIIKIFVLLVLLLILLLPLSPLTFFTAEMRLKYVKKKAKHLESKINVETNEVKRKEYEATLEKLNKQISATELFIKFDELKIKKRKSQPAEYEYDMENEWGLLTKGNFRIVRNAHEFILSGGCIKTQKKIADAAAIVSPGKEYCWLSSESLIDNKSALIEKLDELIALKVNFSLITGNQIYSDGFNHVLAFNGDINNLYDPQEIIKSNGIEFNSMNGQTISIDIKNTALKAYTANQQAEKSINELLDTFSAMLKKIQTSNIYIQTMYID